MGIKNFSLRSVGSYLQENIYYVPDYQREYSWEVENEIDDFWVDLENLINEDRIEHFFGQVVIHNSLEENKKYIIDGQQRTSTSVIFLCALNSLFEDLYKIYNHKASKNRTQDISTKYIGRWEEDENELRLHLGNIDREYFMKFQIGDIKNENGNLLKSHQRIKNSYNYFYNKFNEKIKCLENFEEKYLVLFRYYKKFIDSFMVMYIETDDINEAFIIFETLNARGRDLEIADLLKNHLFRISGKNIEVTKNKWQDMINILDKIDTTKYIRCYWNCKNEFIREKDLYKRIRETLKTSKECEEFIISLVKLSKVYRAMVNPGEEIYFNDIELNQILFNLKMLKASSFYPIILAMTSMNYAEEQIKKVAKIIENLIVRNFVISGKVANRYEVLFAKIAVNIHRKEFENVNSILDIIRKEMIRDDEFKNNFLNFTSKSKPVIRYLLKNINKWSDRETEIINDNRKVHIEHIIPEKIGEWDIAKEDHEEYLWKLGNLTLLGSEYNKKISNKLFEEKKKMYDKSNIIIAKDIVKYDRWDLDTVKLRQEELAEVALKVWSRE